MKFLLILLFSFLLMFNISKSQSVDINIKEVTRFETEKINYNSTITDGKPFKINLELLNSGSVGYKARIRLDIFDKNNLIFTGWSDEKQLFPGDLKTYDLYWYSLNVKGRFKALAKIYFANNITKIKEINFEVKPSSKSNENIFEIFNFRTYEDEVIFLAKSNKTVENIIFMPSNYPSDWIFEQNNVDKFENGDIKVIHIKYEPSLWRQSDVKINIFTEDGKYYTSKTFTLTKENSFWKHINGIINDLRVFLKF